jgi:DNA polymerase-3 subunit delta'
VSKAPRPGKAAPRRRAESTPEPPPPGGDGVLSSLARVAIDDGLLGQGLAQRRLAQALGSGRPHHAWIVSGPMGVGKCTLAVRFAALLVDPDSTPECLRTFTPQSDSRSAELLRQGTHPDVHLIRKELAATSADRELRDRKQLNIPIGLLHESRVSHSSVLGAGKVFIIDEAELLDADGQNALLKTLEEPPPHTTIILVASHEDRLLPTIRSRCQRVPCGPLDPGSMQAWVDRRLDPATPALDWVVGFAGGSPGLALEAIEHGLHAWNEQLQAIVTDLERGAVGPAMAEAMSELVSAFAERVVKANPDASKDAANRKALGLLMAVLGRIVQERLHAASTSGSTDRVDALAACVDALIDAERSVSSNVNQKLVLANLVAQCAPLLSLRGA